MPYIKKFVRGEPINSWDELFVWLSGRDPYVMFGNQDKPMHGGWVRSMQINTVDRAICGGTLYRAAPNPERKGR